MSQPDTNQPTLVESAEQSFSALAHLKKPLVFGTLCGLFSAVVYTAANGFLRAAADFDPFWVSAVKALPTALFMAPWLVFDSRRGQPVFPRPKVWLTLASAALLGQAGGNVPFQFALREIGIAISVPLSLGAMILASAVLSRVFLGESITSRTVLAMLMLITAVSILSLGAGQAHEANVSHAASWGRLLLVFAGLCFSGVSYSILNVVIRRNVAREASLPATLFTVSVVGMVSLGAISWQRIGLAEMFAAPSSFWSCTLLAGVCNAIAFVALTKALQLTSVVYTNALNATQVTMAAVAGTLFFREPISSWLLIGIGLTITGLVLMRKGAADEPSRQHLAAEIQDEP